MNQKSLNFEEQKLVVDYMTFKFQDSQCDQNKIANYLLDLGFNSYQQSGKLVKPVQEKILVNSKNQFEILFVNDNSYWNGTLLHFSGRNASRFYLLAKQNIIDWKIFEKATLSRFDINYCRENQNDRISSTDFLENCYKKLQQTNYKVQLEKNRKGSILKIGNRKANHYSRIYQQNNFLKFEYEMKGRFLQKFHKLLVLNNFEEIELNLTKQFFYHFSKLLPLQYSYFDWLVLQLRPLRQQLVSKDNFNSDYIKSEIKTDPKKLISLLQFVNYAQSLDYEIDSLESTRYRVVTLKLQDFLRFQNKTHNNYQLKKTKDFLEELQTGILLTSFSDNFYQSLVAIPIVRFDKIKKFWVAKVWLVEELFYYKYPFFLPNFFNTKLPKDQFNVRFKFIQVFTSINLEKVFLIKEFLGSYPSVISNQQKKNIKRYFLELVQEMEDNNLIESNYKILMNGSILSTDKLTIQNIGEGFIIYEKILL